MRHCDFNSKVRRSDVHATSSKPETCIQKRRDINLVPLPCITKVFKNKNKFRDMLSRSGWRWSKPFSVENALSYSVIMKEGVVRNAYLQITEGRNGVRRMTIIRLEKKERCEFVKYSATKDNWGHIFNEYERMYLSWITYSGTHYWNRKDGLFSKVAAKAQGSIWMNFLLLKCPVPL